MVLKIDMTGEVPIYQQIRNQIVFGAAAGKLKVGEQLPTVRQLASDIGVNPMTVNKAYALLREEGVIVIDRRHGAKISQFQNLKNSLDEKFDQDLLLLISEARMRGTSQKELESHILQLVRKFYNQEEVLL